MIAAKVIGNEEMLGVIFSRIDQDRTGVISVDNLKKTLGDFFGDMSAEELVHSISQSGKHINSDSVASLTVQALADRLSWTKHEGISKVAFVHHISSEVSDDV